ncbi:class I SAM-dependent methyltransferase [Lutimonas vermicola]|uniref:Class I SAM-dependent methyltransferase n=1 Tax=Lutimonas vermicola TaxID=414288 RepID=A0ABU9L3Z8_9FLAO
MNCPVCSKNNAEFRFIKNGYSILHCKDCDHLFTDYEPTAQGVDHIYSDDYFFKGGVGYDDYTLEKDMLIKRGEYYADKISKHIAPGKVLDVGSAAGFILKGFENKGWNGTGIEPNKSMVDYGRQNLGLNLQQGTIETIELKEKFDLIIIIQVVAHLYDLNCSMNKISNSLNPGGLILIETWDKDSWTSRIFGKYWHEYCPPSTLNYFSKKILNHYMSSHKNLLIDQGTPKKKIHSKHAKSLISHKLMEVKGMNWATVFLKLIPDNVMLPYPSEDLFWALYKRY